MKPAEREIRRTTPYKDFSITNDGSRGHSPQYLYWQFVVTGLDQQQKKRLPLSSLEPDIVEKIQSVSNERQNVIMRAIQAGFDTRYINKLFAIRQDDIVFGANIDLAIMQSEKHRLSAAETGKMIITAVSKNWVSKDSNKDYLKQKEVAHRAKVTQTELDLGIIQEVELETNLKRKAAHYFENMTTEEKKEFFTQKRFFILNVFGHKLVKLFLWCMLKSLLGKQNKDNAKEHLK